MNSNNNKKKLNMRAEREWASQPESAEKKSAHTFTAGYCRQILEFLKQAHITRERNETEQQKNVSDSGEVTNSGH